MLALLVVLVCLGFASSEVINCGAIDCFEAGEKLCADDGHTYAGMCSLMLANCWRTADAKPVHKGPCIKREILDPSHVRCALLDCFGLGDPVCGDDGKFYASSCALLLANCWHDTDVKAVHKGKC